MYPASPVLVLHFPNDTHPELRDRLVAVLADYALLAIQEDALTDAAAWIAHFADQSSRDAARAAIESDTEFAGIDAQPAEVEDDDWARRTQADLPAIRIGRLVVAPPWDLPQPSLALPNPVVVVVIEPSRGFGTGHHQSTRLCLALLQERNVSGLTVVDVGTGSGVLAITAAKLGATFVSAIDHDPDAVENARENIVTNGLDRVVEVHVDDVSTTTVAPADLVMANLTGPLLCRHADDLARLLRPRGTVIVSGFNVDEKERVTEALSRHFSITETAEEDDWWAFVLQARRS